MRRVFRVQCPVSSVRRPRAGLSRRIVKRASHSTLNTQRRARRGTTLTEVLMAILVMGVGILSVMTLFPIAYLRSVQGTQLTNATILKQRAEAIVDMFGLVTDRYIPQPIEGDVTRCLIDPLAWQDVFANEGLARANQYGVDGGLAPVQYTPSNSPVALANIPVAPTRFINVAGLGIARDVWPMPLRRMGFAAQPIDLFNGVPYAFAATNFFGNRQAALGAVRLPDTLEDQFVAAPVSLDAGRTTATFDPATLDFSELTYINNLIAAGGAIRVTLIDTTGKQSQIREHSPASPAISVDDTNGTITWAPPLPAAPNYALLSEVRVETEDPRYTWMLTVRKRGISGGSVTEIDCVIFFNRATEDPEEELVHLTVPLDPAIDVVPPADLAYAVKMSLTPYPSGQTAPLKKGGYVFDPTHAHWYRVQDILSETTAEAIIRLDRRPRQVIPTLVVPRGVIHVFPLKPRVDDGRRLGT